MQTSPPSSQRRRRRRRRCDKLYEYQVNSRLRKAIINFQQFHEYITESYITVPLGTDTTFINCVRWNSHKTLMRKEQNIINRKSRDPLAIICTIIAEKDTCCNVLPLLQKLTTVQTERM